MESKQASKLPDETIAAAPSSLVAAWSITEVAASNKLLSPEFARTAAVHAFRPPCFRANFKFSFQSGNGGDTNLHRHDKLYEAICLKPLWSLTALIKVKIFAAFLGSRSLLLRFPFFFN